MARVFSPLRLYLVRSQKDWAETAPPPSRYPPRPGVSFPLPSLESEG